MKSAEPILKKHILKDIQDINKNHLGAISLTMAILSQADDEDYQQEIIDKLLKFGATGQKLWEIYLHFFGADDQRFCDVMKEATERQMEIIICSSRSR